MGELYAHRYGEPWRNMVGDKLISNLVYKIEGLGLPKSYEAGYCMLSGERNIVTFAFSDAAEAEAFFDAHTSHFDEQEDNDV